MIRFVWQALVVLGFSGLMLYWLGTTYLTIGLLVTVICFVLLIVRWKDSWDAGPTVLQDPDEEPPLSLFAVEFIYRLLLAATFGAIWPSLPIIVGLGSSKSRLGSDD